MGQRTHPRFVIGLAALVFALAGAYAITLARGLTWAHHGADGGDFLTAALTGGVPHPTGYPTYLLMLQLFVAVPLATPALAGNLLSASAAVLTAVCMAVIVYWTELDAGRPTPVVLAVLGGLATGLCSLLWSQAVITEVYSLHAALLAALWLLTLAERRQPQNRWLPPAGGLVAGLALGNQITALFFLPVWLLHSVFIGEGKSRQGGRARLTAAAPTLLLKLVVLALVTGGLYASLPGRAQSAAPIAWGDATGLSGVRWLVSGELYQERLFGVQDETLGQRLAAAAGVIPAQLGLPALVMALIGLLLGEGHNRLNVLASGWLFGLYAGFALLYDTRDSYTHFIPALLPLGFWFAQGVRTALGRLPKGWAWLGLGLATGLLGLHALQTGPEVSAQNAGQAETFMAAALEQAPPNALIFTRGDEDTFSLWYGRYGLGLRPDVEILSLGLLDQPWYRARLARLNPAVRQPLERGGGWLAGFGDMNPARPICEVLWDTTNPTGLECQR